jgi:hypothetical protein
MFSQCALTEYTQAAGNLVRPAIEGANSSQSKHHHGADTLSRDRLFIDLVNRRSMRFIRAVRLFSA